MPLAYCGVLGGGNLQRAGILGRTPEAAFRDQAIDGYGGRKWPGHKTSLDLDKLQGSGRPGLWHESSRAAVAAAWWLVEVVLYISLGWGGIFRIEASCRKRGQSVMI